METINIRVGDTMTIHNGIKVRFKEQRVQGYISKIISGDALRGSTGTWTHKGRVIDRKNDWYEEVVTDLETGAIIHQCAERLSEHQGHGSAEAHTS